jgi:hypothetical protein
MARGFFMVGRARWRAVWRWWEPPREPRGPSQGSAVGYWRDRGGDCAASPLLCQLGDTAYDYFTMHGGQ